MCVIVSKVQANASTVSRVNVCLFAHLKFIFAVLLVFIIGEMHGGLSFAADLTLMLAAD